MDFKKFNLFYKTELLFLKQVHYWTSTGKYGIEKEGRIWIYNSLDQWAEQLGVSKSTIQRTIRSLKKQGIIFPKRRINLQTPYKKLFKRRVFTPKMHIFHTKRCASFTIKDVHLFFCKNLLGNFELNL